MNAKQVQLETIVLEPSNRQTLAMSKSSIAIVIAPILLLFASLAILSATSCAVPVSLPKRIHRFGLTLLWILLSPSFPSGDVEEVI